MYSLCIIGADCYKRSRDLFEHQLPTVQEHELPKLMSFADHTHRIVAADKTYTYKHKRTHPDIHRYSKEKNETKSQAKQQPPRRRRPTVLMF